MPSSFHYSQGYNFNMNISFPNATSSNHWPYPNLNASNADDYLLQLTTARGQNRTFYSFSPITMILTAIPVVLIIIVIVFGNALVVLAVLSQERLKRKTQNWLIVSLAVADLLVGLLIMPFTLVYELLGRWTFGRAFCEMWLAFDVLFVTASIMNLCAISIDRYWSLTDPVHYSAIMSSPKARVRIWIMIASSWLLAFLICLPPLVGWRPEHGENKEDMEVGGGCNLSGDVGYVLYSALGSFFVPLSIVVFIYVKIFVLTRRRIAAQRRKAKQRENLLLVDAPLAKASKTQDMESISLKEGKQSSDSPQSPLQQQAPSNHILTHSSSMVHLRPLHCNNASTQTDNHVGAQSRTSLISRVNTTQTLADEECDTPLVSDPTTPNKASVKKTSSSNAQSVANGGKVNVCAPNLLLRPLELQLRMMQQRKGVRRRERQATLVLGMILGAFVLSWMPFFCSYVLSAVCCQTPELIFDIIFWLGYCNSGLNPFIYNFFNPDFRNAFRKILCRKG